MQSGSIDIQLASPTSFDEVNVDGTFTAGGSLSVSLVHSFSPLPGNSFDILDWSTLSGKFSTVQLPNLTAPLGWDLSDLYIAGIITATNFLPGDINRDGHTNVADIPAMMAALASLTGYQSANGLDNSQLLQIADLSGDSSFTNADIQELINLLANGGGSGNGSLTAVPEPASLVLLALGCVTILCRRYFGRASR
jgi:hypothetical protein